MPCRFRRIALQSASLLVILSVLGTPAPCHATSATATGSVYTEPMTESDYKRLRSEYARERANQALSGKPVSTAPPPSVPIVPAIPAPQSPVTSQPPPVRKAPLMQPARSYSPSYLYLQRPHSGASTASAPTVQKLDTAPVVVSPITPLAPVTTPPVAAPIQPSLAITTPPAVPVVTRPVTTPVVMQPTPQVIAPPVATAPVKLPTAPVSDNNEAESQLEEFLAKQAEAEKIEKNAAVAIVPTPPAPNAPLNTDPLAPPPAPAGLTPVPVGPHVDANGAVVLEVPVAEAAVAIPEPITGPLDENGIALPDKPAEAKISKETREILTLLPEDLTGMPQRKPNLDVDIERAGGDVTIPDGDVVKSESMDMDIKMKQPKMDVSYELEQAYEALVNGNTDVAVTIYREVLTTDQNNTQALFGLATTYHRMGLIDEARPVYGKLLAIDPTHMEALNNFLALVGEESPEAALEIMERLAEKNPEYSPIPAQMAILSQKMDDMEGAVHYMRKAYSLSPENLVYLYNLAILYDKKGDKQEAAAIYKQLLEAYERGQELPATPSEIQERLTFLLSN